ncbi:class I SAM-dependent methyltransferase [Deinococcus rubellus]|uniref:Class I SAM-dependent methyltransferase n=1 Tax=Deinococcus rubellus TaxID=1889240 RepID=A0ABY5YGE6_9DEIO|nr:class I SAM-dependent methyltransferase [Deinococcus rubellus]UWX63472.1 class I SAM-dependent methyltransferase [Deinococcus rubellus]
MLGFGQRLLGAQEKMDDLACDPRQLERTYHHFGLVNDVLSGWRSVYLRRIRPHLSATRPSRLLDIGCGGGDVPIRLAQWAARDRLRLDITAIDADARAIRYASVRPLPSGAEGHLHFRQAMSGDLVREGSQPFDFITSNHLLHHLSAAELQALLDDCQHLCVGTVIHNDIGRSALAYALFGLGTWPLFRESFIHDDGLLSIRRSFSKPELAALAPPGWRVRSLIPFRNLLIYRAPGKRPDA